MKSLAVLGTVVVMGFGLAACRSSSGGGGTGTGGTGTGGSGTGGTNTGGTAGTTNTGGTAGTTNTGGTAGTTNTGGTSAGGADGGGCSPANPSACPGGKCSKPGTLHTDTIYCPFSSVDGGKNADCTPGTQHCCEGLTSADVSVCSATGTACTSGWTDWVCQTDADCGTGKQCCATATLVKNSASQCANYASGFHATQCETTCAAGEIHMCTADAQCASGQTCLPFSTKGAQVGGCYP